MGRRYCTTKYQSPLAEPRFGGSAPAGDRRYPKRGYRTHHSPLYLAPASGELIDRAEAEARFEAFCDANPGLMCRSRTESTMLPAYLDENRIPNGRPALDKIELFRFRGSGIWALVSNSKAQPQCFIAGGGCDCGVKLLEGIARWNGTRKRQLRLQVSPMGRNWYDGGCLIAILPDDAPPIVWTRAVK